MLLLRRKVHVAGTGRYVAVVLAVWRRPRIMDISRTIEQDSEMMRLQLLGDPGLMRQLQEVCAFWYIFNPLPYMPSSDSTRNS